jgi:hypothetical protein
MSNIFYTIFSTLQNAGREAWETRARKFNRSAPLDADFPPLTANPFRKKFGNKTTLLIYLWL